MSVVYKKKLTYIESKRHFIRIGKDHIDKFPIQNVSFYVVVNGKRFEVALGARHRILAAIFWEKLPSFKQGDTIIFSKNKDGFYTVSVEEEKIKNYRT